MQGSQRGDVGLWIERTLVRTSAVHGGLIEMKHPQLLRHLGAWKRQSPVSWEPSFSPALVTWGRAIFLSRAGLRGPPRAGFLPQRRLHEGGFALTPEALIVIKAPDGSELPQARQ